jgi:hypothetical protein
VLQDEKDYKAEIITDPDHAEKIIAQAAAGAGMQSAMALFSRSFSPRPFPGGDEKVYKGMKNYTSFIEKRPSQLKYAGAYSVFLFFCPVFKTDSVRACSELVPSRAQ